MDSRLLGWKFKNKKTKRKFCWGLNFAWIINYFRASIQCTILKMSISTLNKTFLARGTRWWRAVMRRILVSGRVTHQPACFASIFPNFLVCQEGAHINISYRWGSRPSKVDMAPIYSRGKLVSTKWNYRHSSLITEKISKKFQQLNLRAGKTKKKTP